MIGWLIHDTHDAMHERILLEEMTREEVKAKYALVKRWDRAGRMADTQEFKNLAFERSHPVK